MNIFGISINHRTASIEQREAVHFSKNEISEMIPRLKEDVLTEGFVLSTCNRTEIFGFPKTPEVTSKSLQNFIVKQRTNANLSNDNFNVYFSRGAVKHIFNVASGLDSLVLGDSQILGQMKEAFLLSEDLNFVSSLTHKIYNSALKVGKRTISETLLGEGAVSVSFAAIKVVEKIFSNFEGKSALVVGAGETGELVAVHLKDKNLGKLTISNRTFDRAIGLAKKLNGQAIKFEELKNHLHEYDIVISATSADEIVISYDDVLRAMKRRKGTVSCYMDIAIPRDIDPKVQKIDGVFYNNIDSLKILVDQNLKRREKEIPRVKKIIMQEMIDIFSWYNTLDVVPTIKSFRDFFEEIRLDEMNKIRHKVQPEEIEKLDNMTKRLIGRILHNPTLKLKSLSESGTKFVEAKRYSHVLRELFNIDETKD